MSGLEVAALVAGIVSAYSGATSLFRNWRRDRKERKQKKKNQNLEQALVKGSSDVQTTYDDDFRRLGHIFAKGDDIGRGTLAEQLIKLQGTVISILTGNTPISALVHPNHELLSDTSIAVRLRSLSALTEQYQRMSQAAPISPPPPAPRFNKDCDGEFSVHDTGTRWGTTSIYRWQCGKCNWFVDGFWLPHRDCYAIFLEYFHAKGEKSLYRCALCDDRLSTRDEDDLWVHLIQAHGYTYDEEFRNIDDCRLHPLVDYIRAEESKKTAN